MTRDLGLYVSDTFSLRSDLFLTAAARLNFSTQSLTDKPMKGVDSKDTAFGLNACWGK